MSKKILLKEENGIRYFKNGDWIDLSNIPYSKKQIKWSEAIGKIVKINYNNKVFNVNILKYETNSKVIYFLYNNKEYKMDVTMFKDCRFKKIINDRLYKHRYSIGETVNELEILEIIRKNNYKYYKVKCLKDGYTYDILESNLIKGNKCPVCVNKKVIKGINDVSTTHTHLIKYFTNIEDAYKYTYGSNKKLLFKCPDCGYKKEMCISTLTSQGFNCNKCGEHNSYPNRVITELLVQLKVKFKNEKTFKWSNGKVYDFYIASKEIIIEAHGRQHYDGGFEKLGGRTLEEEQENDVYKEKIALENGIKHYIQLDCRKSNIDYIKNNIMNSELPTLLNFKENDINWNECDKNASSSLMIKACELWDSGIHNTKEIGKIIHRSYATVIEYLKHGVELGLCDYTIEESRKRDDTKHIYMYDKDLNFIKEFLSCRQLEELPEEVFGTKFINQCVIRVCLGQRPQYKGYIFSYVPLHKDVVEK